MQDLAPDQGIPKLVYDFVSANPWSVYVIAGAVVLAIVWRQIATKFGRNPNWYNSTKLDKIIELEEEEAKNP